MKVIDIKSSKGDRIYKVYLFENGQAKCICPAYTFRKYEGYECKHIARARTMVKNDTA